MTLLKIGAPVWFNGNEHVSAGIVTDIKKCREGGTCTLGLDGVHYSMLTEKIKITVDVGNEYIEITGANVEEIK